MFGRSDETLFRVFEGIKSPNSMQIKSGYLNFLHGSDFLCVLVMNNMVIISATALIV